MGKRVKLLTWDDWPIFAQTDSYSPWKTTGEGCVKKKIEDAWNKRARQICPNDPKASERRERGLPRILDSWIWRLNREASGAPDPDDVFKRITTNGPFPYWKSKKTHTEVDLFFDLTLASLTSDGEEKAIETFGRLYGDEVKTFVKNLAKEYADGYVKDSEKAKIYEQFGIDDGSFVADAQLFSHWLRYFVDEAESSFKRYRGIAPLRAFLRIELYRLYRRRRRVENRAEERERKIRMKLTEEVETNDETDSWRIVDKNQECEKVKKALEELKRKNDELYQIAFYRDYDNLTFLEIASKLNYSGSDDAKEKRANRKYDKAIAELKKLLAKQDQPTEGEK